MAGNIKAIDDKVNSSPIKIVGIDPITGEETNQAQVTQDSEVYAKISPEPLWNTLPKCAALANTVGGSENLNVDGSITPQIYRFAPAAGEIWFLNKLTTMIADPGNTSYLNFGSGAALINGVLIEVKSKGILHQIANIKTNAEMTIVFSGGNVESTGGVIGSGTWLNESDLFSANFAFFVPVILQNSTADYIQVTIRDNLSTIDLFKMWFTAFKRNP